MSLTTRSSRRSSAGALGLTAAAALLVLAAGCGSPGAPPDDQQSDQPPSQDQASQPQQAPSSAGQADPSAGGASADPSKDLGDPVASRDGSTQVGDAKVDLFAVTRADRLITVNFSMTLDESAEEKFQIADFFSDNNFDASDGEGHAVDGVQVLDTKNAKLHQVASDGSKHCVCSRGLSATFVQPGQTMFFTAAYGAPPEDVTTVDVQVPHFGTFSDVPVK